MCLVTEKHKTGRDVNTFPGKFMSEVPSNAIRFLWSILLEQTAIFHSWNNIVGGIYQLDLSIQAPNLTSLVRFLVSNLKLPDKQKKNK